MLNWIQIETKSWWKSWSVREFPMFILRVEWTRSGGWCYSVDCKGGVRNRPALSYLDATNRAEQHLKSLIKQLPGEEIQRLGNIIVNTHNRVELGDLQTHWYEEESEAWIEMLGKVLYQHNLAEDHIEHLGEQITDLEEQTAELGDRITESEKE